MATLDVVDHRIIAALERDSRLSVRALAEEVNISRANAYKRLQRLTESRTITGFTIGLDPACIGLGTSAYIALSIQQNSWRDIRDHLRRIPEVWHVALVGAEFDVLLLVRAADNDAMRSLVFNRLQEIPGVLSTRTWLIFDDDTNRQPLAPGTARRSGSEANAQKARS